LILFSSFCYAEIQDEVGLDEQLGKQIPLSLTFIDEKGNNVKLSELVKKPTLFLLVYYDCNSQCSPLQAEVVSHINKLDLQPGEDYQIISISFDETEKWKLASDKKQNYLNAVEKDFPEDAWKFLTGDQESIKRITKAFGFSFKKVGEEYTHPSTIIAVSPDGRITRYLLGTSFLTFDIKMSLIEASEGKIGPTISKFYKFCFSYDAEGKKYVLNVTRIAAVGIILLAIVFVIVISIKPKLVNKGS
jgi:protein SCO1/2